MPDTFNVYQATELDRKHRQANSFSIGLLGTRNPFMYVLVRQTRVREIPPPLNVRLQFPEQQRQDAHDCPRLRQLEQLGDGAERGGASLMKNGYRCRTTDPSVSLKRAEAGAVAVTGAVAGAVAGAGARRIAVPRCVLNGAEAGAKTRAGAPQQVISTRTRARMNILPIMCRWCSARMLR